MGATLEKAKVSIDLMHANFLNLSEKNIEILLLILMILMLVRLNDSDFSDYSDM